MSFTLHKCILTKNRCYSKGAKISGAPYGIIVHSTGANNPNLKRYVQPSADTENRAELLKQLGTNSNSNDWNRDSVSVCVHAFIGKAADGSVQTWQTLPFDICAWGCGSGKNGSMNYNPTACIQFEICEDTTDKAYTEKVYAEAVAFCAYLCKTYAIPVSHILSHNEAHEKGYASNHGDPEHWWKNYGYTMNQFRKDVEKVMAATENTAPSGWAKEACEWCVANGIFAGDGTGNYKWKDNVTREQAAVLLHSFAKLIGKA